jgi:hypothetical protein
MFLFENQKMEIKFKLLRHGFTWIFFSQVLVRVGKQARGSFVTRSESTRYWLVR